MEKAEPIRDWYRRATRRAMRAVAWSSIALLVGAVALFFTLSGDATLRLQVFNGAYTIPVAALVWIVAFTVIWLVPMRELGFRSQESMERLEARLGERVDRLDAIVGRVERIVAYVEKATDRDVVGRLEDHLKAIREAVDRQTRPLPVTRRPVEGVAEPVLTGSIASAPLDLAELEAQCDRQGQPD